MLVKILILVLAVQYAKCVIITGGIRPPRNRTRTPQSPNCPGCPLDYPQQKPITYPDLILPYHPLLVSGLGLLRGYPTIATDTIVPVNAAVVTLSKTIDYRSVPYSAQPIVPQVVNVPPSEQPVQLNFLSKSSPLFITQQHIPGEPGQVQITRSEDEVHRLIHTVTKPVIQQVIEIIQPYRQLTQEINPVVEQANTIVAQGEGPRLNGLSSGIIEGTGVLRSGHIATTDLRLGVATPVVGVGGLRVRGVYETGLGLSPYRTGFRSARLGGRRY